MSSISCFIKVWKVLLTETSKFAFDFLNNQLYLYLMSLSFYFLRFMNSKWISNEDILLKPSVYTTQTDFDVEFLVKKFVLNYTKRKCGKNDAESID